MSTACGNAAASVGNSTFPPGNSTACGVSFEGNNTAVLADCCNGAPIREYSLTRSEWGLPNCYQYCNISGPLFNESTTYKCLWNRDRNTNLTGMSCRDAFQLSGAQPRLSNKVLLIGIVLVAGGFLFHVEL